MLQTNLKYQQYRNDDGTQRNMTRHKAFSQNPHDGAGIGSVGHRPQNANGHPMRLNPLTRMTPVSRDVQATPALAQECGVWISGLRTAVSTL